MTSRASLQLIVSHKKLFKKPVSHASKSMYGIVSFGHKQFRKADCGRQINTLLKTTESLWTTNNMYFYLQTQLSPEAPSHQAPYNQVSPFTHSGVQHTFMTTGNKQVINRLRNRSCYTMNALHSQQRWVNLCPQQVIESGPCSHWKSKQISQISTSTPRYIKIV